MANSDHRQELDAQTLILGLGYASALLTLIFWIASSIT